MPQQGIILIKRNKQLIIAGASGLIFSFCAMANESFEKAYQSFDINQIKAHIKTLSSDKFEGREPSTPGEKLTTDLLIKEFKQIGLEPGNKGSYLQSVPMVAIESTPKSNLTIADISFEFPKNFVASSRQTQQDIALEQSELVFVGYGINAPEYGWNDYKNVDVKGKTVVVLVNDPGSSPLALITWIS